MVLVQANATAEVRIVTDPSSLPELADYFVENILARQPNGAFSSAARLGGLACGLKRPKRSRNSKKA